MRLKKPVCLTGIQNVTLLDSGDFKIELEKKVHIDDEWLSLQGKYTSV
jgi:hypothetical protein